MLALPEVYWDVDDDLCDCTYQRMGLWTNPYLAETLEVRMCCIWKELYKMFPQFVRQTPAFFDYNANEWVPEPREWDGESDMPAAIWYRQMARKEGISVAEARQKYAGKTPPLGTPKPAEPAGASFNEALMEMLFDIVGRLEKLETSG